MIYIHFTSIYSHIGTRTVAVECIVVRKYNNDAALFYLAVCAIAIPKEK